MIMVTIIFIVLKAFSSIVLRYFFKVVFLASLSVTLSLIHSLTNSHNDTLTNVPCVDVTSSRSANIGPVSTVLTLLASNPSQTSPLTSR